MCSPPASLQVTSAFQKWAYVQVWHPDCCDCHPSITQLWWQVCQVLSMTWNPWHTMASYVVGSTQLWQRRGSCWKGPGHWWQRPSAYLHGCGPRDHTSGSPLQSPLEAEKPAGATCERSICPASGSWRRTFCTSGTLAFVAAIQSLDLVASWAVWTGTGGQQQTKPRLLTCYCVKGQNIQAADRNTHAPPVVPRGLLADVKSHCLTVWLAVSLNLDADRDPALWGIDRSAHPLHDWESLRMKQAARTKTKCWETTKSWGRGEWQGSFPRLGEALFHLTHKAPTQTQGKWGTQDTFQTKTKTTPHKKALMKQIPKWGP